MEGRKDGRERHGRGEERVREGMGREGFLSITPVPNLPLHHRISPAQKFPSLLPLQSLTICGCSQ